MNIEVQDEITISKTSLNGCAGCSHLAIPANSGLLMLIGKLIGYSDPKVENGNGDGKRSFHLANALLNNFHKTKVIVVPSKTDDLGSFVKRVVQDAQNIIAQRQEKGDGLYDSAEALINLLDGGDSSQEPAKLEKAWKEFVVLLFKSRT